MLLAGDEFGRTQRGNNNAYCQDNELSWFDWNWSPEQRKLFEFVKRLLRLRRAHPALRRAHFFQGRTIRGTELHDIAWFRHDGQPMSERRLERRGDAQLDHVPGGRGIDDLDEEGRPLVDDDLLLLINASATDVAFKIPKLPEVRETWHLLVDTADDDAEETRRRRSDYRSSLARSSSSARRRE